MRRLLLQLVSGLVVSLLIQGSAAQTACRSQRYANRLYASCNDLPQLNSFLHWTYHPSNGSASIAYRAPMGSSGWIAYALNPTGRGMVGAEVLMGVRLANGTTFPYTTRINSYRPTMMPEPLRFGVSGLAVDVAGGAMTIFANIQLPGNRTTISHVWQEGPASPSLSIHPLDDAHKASVGTLDLLSGAGAGSGAIVPRLRRKNVRENEKIPPFFPSPPPSPPSHT